MSVGNIITLVAVCIGLVGHIVATVWWAATVNTTLKIVVGQVGDLVVELKSMKNLYVKKEQYSKDMALVEKNQEAIWRKLDEIKS